ncbi:MAG: nucleotidyltransferase family protein [Acholeplasmataceae bacterium]
MILEYTRCALAQTKSNKPIENEAAFFQQAKESGLFGFCFEAMDETIVSKRLYEQSKRIYFSFIQKDLSQQALKEKINHLFNEHHIDHVFLKGIHLKELYPKPYLRGMGDIDCLIKEKDILKTQKLLKEAGFKLDSKSDVHDVYYYHYEMLEIHQKIYKETHKADKHLLRYPWDYVYHVENYEYRLKKEYELLHLIHHLSKHILSSGVGFRSLLDIQIYLKEMPLDKELLYTYLKEVGLFEFFKVIIAFNKKAFNLDTAYNEADISEEDYALILSYLYKSGIHGKGGNFNPMASRLSKQSKFKIILKVLFPSYQDMKNKYKPIRYIPILLPFFYPVRWFTLLFLKRKQTKKQLNKLNQADTNLSEMKAVIETFKLGDYDI